MRRIAVSWVPIVVLIAACKGQTGDALDTEPATDTDAVETDTDVPVEDTDCEPLTWYADIDDDGWGNAPVEACEQPSWTSDQGGDCDDADPGVYPGLAELCDGVDQDCDGVIDDGMPPLATWYEDVDGDGYGDDLTAVTVCEEAEGRVPVGGDCDPLDGDVFPGAEEILGDGVDSDCAAGDGVVFDDNGWTWEEPLNVVAVATTGHLAIVTAAKKTSSSPYSEPGLMIPFELGSAAPGPTVTWQNVTASPNPLGASVDAEATGADVYASTSYYSASAFNVYDIAKAIEYNASLGTWSYKLEYYGVRGDGARLDHDLAVAPDGKAWTFSCSDEGVVFMRIEPTGGTVPWNYDGFGCDGSSSCEQSTGAHGSACWIDPSASPATATACDGASCTTWELDPATSGVTAASAQPWSAEAWIDVNAQGAWVAATDGIDGAVIWSGGSSYEVLSGYAVRAVTAADDGAGGVLIAAAVEDVTGDGAADVVLAWGAPGALRSIEMALTNGADTWSATSASAAASGDVVLLAAAGTGAADDRVAWAFVTLE